MNDLMTAINNMNFFEFTGFVIYCGVIFSIIDSTMDKINARHAKKQ